MLERRSLLAGLAALPAVGLPPTTSTAALPNPFAVFHAEMGALHTAIQAARSDDEAAPFMARWAQIDGAVMHLRPATLDEAASALDIARREYVQFVLQEDETGGDDGERLVLHLIDGVLAMLRGAGAGGRA